MLGNRAAFGAALFQDTGCEGMSKIMDARLPTSIRRDARSSQDAAECIVHRRWVKLSVLDGWEEPIALACKLASRVKIAFERLDDGRVQRHQPAFTELGFANVQYAVMQNVSMPPPKAVCPDLVIGFKSMPYVMRYNHFPY